MKFDPELGMPVPDMTRMLSGHPQGAPDPASTLSGHDMAVIGPTFTSFRLPFGVVYPANLTPDRHGPRRLDRGDVRSRDADRAAHGRHGRPVLPPMPWMNLARQSDDDLKAIFAYLHTVPAIRNDVPAPQVPDQVMDGIAAGYEKILSRMKGQARPTGGYQDGRAVAQAVLVPNDPAYVRPSAPRLDRALLAARGFLRGDGSFRIVMQPSPRKKHASGSQRPVGREAAAARAAGSRPFEPIGGGPFEAIWVGGARPSISLPSGSDGRTGSARFGRPSQTSRYELARSVSEVDLDGEPPAPARGQPNVRALLLQPLAQEDQAALEVVAQRPAGPAPDPAAARGW